MEGFGGMSYAHLIIPGQQLSEGRGSIRRAHGLWEGPWDGQVIFEKYRFLYFQVANFVILTSK